MTNRSCVGTRAAFFHRQFATGFLFLATGSFQTTALGAPPQAATGATHKASSAAAQPQGFEAICKDGLDNDKDGLTDCADTDCQSPGGDCVPPPPLDRTVATTVFEDSEFVFRGKNPLQKAVTAKITRAEIAQIAGTVVDEQEEPLPGVKVSILETGYGYTYTRADGRYFLAVNGGAHITLDYSREGYLPVKRDLAPRSQHFEHIDTLGLVRRAGGKTSIVEVGAQHCQFVLGQSRNDRFGKRQPLFVIEPETTAQAVLPQGAKQPLSSVTLTLTEYPPHRSNLFAVSNPPPHGAGVAYGVDRDVAEASQLGASVVELSKPATMYFENFLKLPAKAAPTATSDDEISGQRIRELPPRVVKIVGKHKGVAKVDVNGDGKADNPVTISQLGFTQCELEALVKQYPVGTSLVRSRTFHL